MDKQKDRRFKLDDRICWKRWIMTRNGQSGRYRSVYGRFIRYDAHATGMIVTDDGVKHVVPLIELYKSKKEAPSARS